jgi:lipopolysaccharide export system permease protein
MVVYGVDFFIVAKLIYYLVVAFLPITGPISFLFSVLLVFSRLSSDNEIMAFKASGISIYQLILPVSFVSLIAGLITFYVSFYEGPWGNRNFENTIHMVGSSRASIQVKPGFFNEDLVKGFVLYTVDIDSQTGTMKKLFIYDERDKSNPVVITSKLAKIEVDDTTKEDRAFLYDGYINFLENKEEKYREPVLKNNNIVSLRGEYSL